MLALSSVTKRYGNLVALDAVSLEIAPGEFFGLLGPNGAGKSTLMSLAAGLRTPDAGEIALGGAALSKSNLAARLSLGLVPQSIALYSDLTAEQNLRLFGQLYGLRGSDLQTRIDEALESVQLADRRHSAVKTFSGGMQRRLNIVASLLHRPKILLCDEPTVGIDLFSHAGPLLVLIVSASAACTAFGMLVAAVSSSPEMANGLATLLVLVMSAVGGAWVPVSFMPEYIQHFSKFTLVYWSIEGFTAVLWAGHGFVEILPKLGILLGIAVGIMAIATWCFKRSSMFD